MSLSRVPSFKRNCIFPQNTLTSDSLYHTHPILQFLDNYTLEGSATEWEIDAWHYRKPAEFCGTGTSCNHLFSPQSKLCLFWCEQTVTWWHCWWIGKVVLYDTKVTGGRENAIMHKLTDGILLCPQSGGDRVLTYSLLLTWNYYFKLLKVNTRPCLFCFECMKSRSPTDKPLQIER